MLYNFKKLLLDRKDIPVPWIFKHFYEKYTGREITEPFDGRNIKVLSCFTQENTPSMFFYYDIAAKEYRCKDHSGGFYGNCYTFAQKLTEQNNDEWSIDYLISEYENNHDNITIEPIVSKPKLEVAYSLRGYEFYDKEFFGKFNIKVDDLEFYNIIPFNELVVSKKQGDEYIFRKEFETYHSYGFFNNNGELQKIYQPYRPKDDFKFITVNSKFIQGEEQLEYQSKNLVIVSSLKDGLALRSLELDLEFVASNSENTLIPLEKISHYLSKYENVFTLFDDDEAGLKAMKVYEQRYGLPFVYLKMNKDIADAVNVLPIPSAKLAFAHAINKTINKNVLHKL